MGTNITGIGNANAIGFKSRVTGGMYFPPELKDTLVGVWSAYGKSNNSTDRNIIKNKIKDKGGDFVISNAAFKLNSGFGFYTNFRDAGRAEIEVLGEQHWLIKKVTNVIPEPILIEANKFNRYGYLLRIKCSGIVNTKDVYTNVGGRKTFLQNGINIIDAKNEEVYSSGFIVFGIVNDATNIEIQILPEFEDAFVTDGIDDMITSAKTVQEMLGGSDEITVVSMIHQIDGNVNYTNGYTNYIRHSGGFIRNVVAGANGKGFNKTGIYGYTSANLNSSSSNLGNIVNNILGDKDDYSFERSSSYTLDDAKYSVQNFVNANNQPSNEGSSIAWYWTFIANKVLTTDEINQVIAYYNLDRTLKPDILCDVKKQGITNENHAEFNDKLIDYSGNGRDIQLNNIAWRGDSGIGKYNFSNIKIINNRFEGAVTTNKCHFTKKLTNTVSNFCDLLVISPNEPIKFKVSGLSDGRKLFVANKSGSGSNYNFDNGEHEVSLSFAEGVGQNNPFGVTGDIGDIDVTVEFIPSYAGALCLDGVDDFGKVTGMPVYKDYTVVAKYQRLTQQYVSGIGGTCPISKSHAANQGAFIMDAGSSSFVKTQCYSFGALSPVLTIDNSNLEFHYQTKYIFDSQNIVSGNGVDGDTMWLGTFRDNDARFFNGVIYSLMSFPYSMSEFLIERQLKKHKLGTLYPDMVEFRPIVKSNNKWDIIEIWQGDKSLYRPAINDNKTGIYLKKDSTIGIYVKPKDADEVTKIVVNGTEYTNLKINSNGFYYVTLPITKSPQKINITIDEYIRYEDIVQPYPVVVGLGANSWGSKLKVGSTISYIGMVNLLAGLYEIRGTLLFNGTPFNKNSGLHKIEKNNVFSFSDSFKYLLDNNEPKVILSPSRLRIPNSSYKILGHIPDISGHGNHGKINNSAYAGMSGANGYVEDFTTWGIYGGMYGGVILTDSTIKTNSDFRARDSWVAYKSANKTLNSFSVNITGIPKEGILNFRVNADTYIELSNGRNDLFFDNILISVSSGFRITKGSNLDWSNLVIQQIGEYEGAYCLDGVDDYIKIDTNGGMTMLMKANVMSTVDKILYDQRDVNSEGLFKEFAIMTSNSDSLLAYAGRNPTGKTYIDGILNANITCGQLLNITHNITALAGDNTSLGKGGVIIGASKTPASYCRAAVFDFMLFDEISTDDKIKELNEYVGIEGDFNLDFNNDFLIGN